MYFQSEGKTEWILIRWLRQKPADQDLQCFQKKRINEGSAGQGLTVELEIVLVKHCAQYRVFVNIGLVFFLRLKQYLLLYKKLCHTLLAAMF